MTVNRAERGAAPGGSGSTTDTWDPTLRGLLEHMLVVDASDLYLTAGSPPVFRIDGVGYTIHKGRLLVQIPYNSILLLERRNRQDKIADRFLPDVLHRVAAACRVTLKPKSTRGRPEEVEDEPRIDRVWLERKAV